MTALHDLYNLGQSIWYDNLSRGMLKSGDIQRLIDQGIRGITSNPSIFEKAIAQTPDYDDELKDLSQNGKPAQDIFETLAFADIQSAADLLRPIYDESNKTDGFISLEVSPDLAHDTQGTIDAVERYVQAIDRPNLMVKIPATPEGIPAIQHSIAQGYNINITLMFSLTHYDVVAEAYLSGLEALAQNGGDLASVASVASFFVSRIDGKVDPLLQEAGNQDLLGKIAVANAKLAYERFEQTFTGDRWAALADQGAQYQRLLWASTSTKNPNYPDTLYVDTLIGKPTVNTVPNDTLDAILDHATIQPDTIQEGLEEAHQAIKSLADLGLDFEQITTDLQAEGVQKFAQSYHGMLKSIEQKQPA